MSGTKRSAAAIGGDVRRNVCQLLLDQGYFSEPELLEAFRDCLDRHNADAKKHGLKWHKTKDGEAKDEDNRKELRKVVDALDDTLGPIGLKVASMKSKSSGSWQTYYGVVNLLPNDSFSKLADGLSKKEQELYTKVVADITSCEDEKIDTTDAANLRTCLDSGQLSALDAQSCLERLAAGGWLASDNEGNYRIGVRTELQARYKPTDDE